MTDDPDVAQAMDSSGATWKQPDSSARRPMNRNQRRTLGRAMRRTGKVVVTLSGGPMNGWLVKPDAPCLQPAWRTRYLEAIAEQIYRQGQRGWLRPKWDKVPEPEKVAYLEQAKAMYGAGHYVMDSTGTEAKWVTV